jgi:hypothetical protein
MRDLQDPDKNIRGLVPQRHPRSQQLQDGATLSANAKQTPPADRFDVPGSNTLGDEAPRLADLLIFF